MKKAIQNMALFIVTILIVLIILEIIVKFTVSTPRFDRQLNDIWYFGVPNSEGIYRTKEFETHYKFNSLGFRDNEHAVEKPKNTCRIAVLGDSFAEAMEVELDETWPRLLENKLNNRYKNKKFEILNFGMAGGGTSNEYFVLERHALQYEPDIVVLAFFNGNDINNNYIRPTGKYFALDENENLIEVPQKPESIITKILRSSNLAAFAKRNYEIFMLKVSGMEITEYYGVFLADYPKDWEKAWEVTEKVLARMNDLSDKNNAKLVVLIANAKEQVNQELWEEILKNSNALSEKEWDMKKPNRLISSICKKNNLACMDPFDAFLKSYGKGIDPHFAIDKHWNKEGHELVAEFVLANIDGIAKNC